MSTLTLTAEFASKKALSDLLFDIQAALRRYLVIGDAEFVTLSLFTLHTHAFELSEEDAVGQYPYHSPYLRITSAVKRCGKTRALEVLNLLVVSATDSERAANAPPR